MATIHNTDLIRELKEGGKLQQLRDVIPSQLADKVVPVMEVNPKLLRRVNLIRTATSASTIYTTPTDKDFFLTSLALTGANNVASKNSNLTVTATPKGDANVVIAGVLVNTSAILDVGNQCIFQNYANCPILLERGTAIALTSTDMSHRRATITGYLVENINA